MKQFNRRIICLQSQRTLDKPLEFKGPPKIAENCKINAENAQPNPGSWVNGHWIKLQTSFEYLMDGNIHCPSPFRTSNIIHFDIDFANSQGSDAIPSSSIPLLCMRADRKCTWLEIALDQWGKSRQLQKSLLLLMWTDLLLVIWKAISQTYSTCYIRGVQNAQHNKSNRQKRPWASMTQFLSLVADETTELKIVNILIIRRISKPSVTNSPPYLSHQLPDDPRSLVLAPILLTWQIFIQSPPQSPPPQVSAVN